MVQINATLLGSGKTSVARHTAHTEKPEFIIEANDYTFDPQHIELVASKETTIMLENNGAQEHDFEIIGSNYHLHTMPGTVDTMSVIFLKPGKYEAVCTLPGHAEAGMKATLTVTES